MRAVLDTNVLVRSSKNATGPARECFLSFESDRHILLVSQYLLAELARVMTYPRVMAQHKLSPEEIREFLLAVETVGEIVETPQDEMPAVVSADPNDDPIVQLAVLGHAEVLCTLDRHIRSDSVKVYCHSFGVRVLTDVELLAELRKSQITPGDSGK